MADSKRLSELHAAGRELGLLDLDLCVLVDEGVPADEGLRLLRRQYPAAFARRDARDMKPDEYKKALADVLGENRELEAEKRRSRIGAESAKGDVRGLSRAEYEQRLADMLRAIR